ncbi:MAG: alpha/beta hydrolase [Acidimicrobiia bacterium]
MSLQKPPTRPSSSRAVGRILMLLVLALGAGIVIYTAVTNQRADLTEDTRAAALDLEDTTLVDGVRINVVTDQGGSQPVVILHDVDVTGGMILADLSRSLGEPYQGVRLDLPGFGYSDRIPSVDPRYTAAGMASIVAGVVQQRYDSPVMVVGVGFGGEVAADLALTYGDLVAGLVMVDTDFWGAPSLEVSLEQLPWVGKAATYTWETGGRFALDTWAPDCDDGGWCPTDSQLAERASIVTIESTTDAVWSFRRTEEGALAPSNLGDITVPVAYVWSTAGDVSQETVDRLTDEMTALQVVESESSAAHLEDYAAVTQALGSLTSQ